MEDVGKLYGHLVYLKAIWYILWLFGIFFYALVCCTKKDLATLVLPQLADDEDACFCSKELSVISGLTNPALHRWRSVRDVIFLG
jgi:hypothetical protein